MSVKIRLSRHGAKKHPYYWIVAADARAPRDGAFKERIGSYNPMLASGDPKRVLFDSERARHWLSCGAQPTDRVRLFFERAGIVEKRPIKETPKQSAPKKKAASRQ